MSDAIPPLEHLDEKKHLGTIAHIDHLDQAYAHAHSLDHGSSTSPASGALVHRTSLEGLSARQALTTYRRAVLLASMIAFSATCDGYQVNLNGSIVANAGFIKQFGTVVSAKGIVSLDATYVSLWGGMQSVGQVVAMLSLTYLGDKFGRRLSLYAIWIFMVGSVLTESLAKTPQAWLGAKLLAGIAVGGMQATVPVYITEIAPNQLRGMLVNAYSLWFVFGQFLAPLALYFMQQHNPTQFRQAILTQWAFVGLVILFWAFVPESPWWAVSQGKEDVARKTLVTINGSIPGYDVELELSNIRETIRAERVLAEEASQVGYFDIFKGQNGWRLFIACWPKCMQQLTGLSVVNSYSSYFFQLAGNKQPFRVTIILACVQMATIIVYCFFTDVARRPSTIYGFLICSLSLLAIGIIGCFDYASYSLGSLLIFFACLAISSNTGAGAVGYAYVSEIPTQRLRQRTAGFGLAAAASLGVCFSFSVPIMLKGAPAWGIKTGFFFACTGVPGSILLWFILPETSRRAPAELDELFAKRVPPRKFKGYVTDVQRDSEVDQGKA